MYTATIKIRDNYSASAWQSKPGSDPYIIVNGNSPRTFYQGGSVSGDYEVSIDLPSSELVLGDNTFKFATKCHSTRCGLILYLDDGGQADHTTGYHDDNYGPDYPIVWDGDLVFEITSHTTEIEASVNIDPDTLNLKSHGKWITCYVTLPEGYNVDEVIPQSLLLEEQIAPTWSYVDDEQVLKIKFNRSDVLDLLQSDGLNGAAEVELLIGGEMTDGTLFAGTDMIRIINPGKKK